jgi:hypothetical protein
MRGSFPVVRSGEERRLTACTHWLEPWLCWSSQSFSQLERERLHESTSSDLHRLPDRSPCSTRPPSELNLHDARPRLGIGHW